MTAGNYNAEGLLEVKVLCVTDSNIFALLRPLPVGIRMLDGDVTDIVEAQSLSFRPQYIDIYLASWGPEDDGATLGGPGPLTRLALQNGIKTVREREREFVCER